ncbi:MAG: rhomboid family intramembrane serine protease [Gammaproteobacteria bacterium]|nr:rhomboid family intramembrane serine protease [Gammaproteobacteria bacterium]
MYPRVPVHIAIIIGYFVMRLTIPAVWMLGIWLALQALIAFATIGAGQQGGIAFWAHIGGFVAGFLLIRLFHIPRTIPGREV